MNVFLDACSIIYFLESKQELGIGTRRFINDALKNNALLQVSRLSFLECRYMPLKEKNFDLLAEYDQFFLFDCLQIIELGSEVVNLATQLKEVRAQLLSHGRSSGVQAKHYDRYAYLPEKRDASGKWETFLNGNIIN
jgi:hypothetical protein